MKGHFCGDCGEPTGKNHLEGCDIERCPRCKGQLLSCNCHFVGGGTGFLMDDEGDNWIRFLVQNSIDEDFDMGGEQC